MHKTPIIAAIVLAPAMLHAQQSGRALIDDVARAMGGRARITAVKTLVLTGKGRNYNFGQNPTPTDSLPVYEVTSFSRSIDFANRRWRQDQTREPRFVTANTAAVRQRIGFDNGVSVDIISDTLTRRGTARADSDRADELLYHPIGFMQAALSSRAKLADISFGDARRHVRMTLGPANYEIVIDPATKLPYSISRTVSNSMLGDVTLETRFADWTTVDGLKLPMRIAQRVDRWEVSNISLTSSNINADVGDISAPASVKSSPPFAPAAVTVAVDSVAPGVWYITGQTHHSVAIEMSDHILLVEAPVSDDRTLAVVRKVRELRPDKPIRAVINTHHHFDHSGGVRAAISEGLAVITDSVNAPFYRQLWSRKFTIAPDALAKSRKPAVIEVVNGKRVLTSGNRTVELYHIAGSVHSGSMLMVYLPAEKMLIEADLYSPPAANATTIPPAPFAKNLVDNIDRLGLKVETIVPIHGRVVPMSDLRAVAAR
jgi:glyoxylase-like metal-dependent hydrolase (beta-lactamase superfamily II)